MIINSLKMFIIKIFLEFYYFFYLKDEAEENEFDDFDLEEESENIENDQNIENGRNIENVVGGSKNSKYNFEVGEWVDLEMISELNIGESQTTSGVMLSGRGPLTNSQ